jgi:hypothetical protein
MATWVEFKKVRKFPAVLQVYKRAGWGQGTGQGIIATNPPSSQLVSAQRGFARTVQIFFQGKNLAAPAPALPGWIRKSPLSNSNDWQDCQIDVTAIPGVRPLRDNGKWVNYVG